MKTDKSLSDNRRKLKLVAVTKNRKADEIKAMLKRYKILRIAENRLKEAEDKFPHLSKSIEKHFIGKLQSRKIKRVVKLFDVIQSVENLKQAKLISMQEKPIVIYLQVNISKKENRSGADPSEAKDLIKQISTLPNIKLVGVMGIASQDPIKARKEFKLLKDLQGSLKECSMGMSGDFQIALDEGSTLLRLGRVLFQEHLPNLPKFE